MYLAKNNVNGDDDNVNGDYDVMHLARNNVNGDNDNANGECSLQRMMSMVMMMICTFRGRACLMRTRATLNRTFTPSQQNMSHTFDIAIIVITTTIIIIMAIFDTSQKYMYQT